MKKSLLSAALLLPGWLRVLAQNNEEEHNAEYNWGDKNAAYVIIGVIVIIIFIIWAMRRKRKGS
ncbi:MAG: LPXTG cell wall anchor domain-containing protein [Bacteroidota bacterium]|nr:LPXTG cell wall anchor domain-containing protein [Bacteroidota bacterium]